jgi:TPR repeat protein
MNTDLAIIPKPTQKETVLPPEIHKSVQNWSNSFFRPSIPTNLIEKSVVTEIIDERAKLLTAVYLYGVREGARKEIPYNDGDISNRTDNLNEESLWLYGRRYAHAPTVFSPVKLPSFNISTGETHKCSKCKGEGKVNCWGCKGTGQDKTQTCHHCTGKGCRYCKGTGKAIKDCPLCKGSGTTTCRKCTGYKYVQVVIEVETSYKVKNLEDHDYKGEVPPMKLKKTTGVAVFEEVANYPSEGMREMLIGGLNRQEYGKLQLGVANVFHSLVDNKIQNYDGDINLVHGLIDNFFKQIPDAFQENRVLKREILPVRLKIKVEDVPVKKVSYTYKDKAYTLWIYGKENKIYSRKRPFGFTGRLLVSWIIQIIIVGLVVYWLTGPHTQHAQQQHAQQAQEKQIPVETAAGDATPTHVDSYAKNLQAAEQGNPEAESDLGLMYAKGDGVAKDSAMAVQWFTKAAQQGLARAQNNLGVMYEDGNGVAKDDVEAVKWFRAAAEQGFAPAQDKLAAKYLNGEGVARDPIEALKWFAKSAEQGNPEAESDLGLMYAKGDGVAKDSAMAVQWFTKAAQQGLARAQNNLGVMYIRHGFSRPDDPARRRTMQIPKRLGKDRKAALAAIDKAVSAGVTAGRIKDRYDVMLFLEQAKFKITRHGKNYLSIQDEGGDTMRLKGLFYESGFDSRQLAKGPTGTGAGPNSSPPETLADVEKRFANLFVGRIKNFQKRHRSKHNKIKAAALGSVGDNSFVRDSDLVFDPNRRAISPEVERPGSIAVGEPAGNRLRHRCTRSIRRSVPSAKLRCSAALICRRLRQVPTSGMPMKSRRGNLAQTPGRF